MDRRRALQLGAALALGGVSVGATAVADPPPLRAMAWLDGAGALEALTSEPADSGGAIPDVDGGLSPDRNRQRAAGEVLFHSPTLLGGQAAKAGISCASCHANGHDNRHFQFPGVSGAPGTADVTHSFFSSHRGDGRFNPAVIPDLGMPGKVSRIDDGELESFIQGLIVEEFDGVEPGASTLAALAAYVRSVGPPARSRQPVTLATHWRQISNAFAAAEFFAHSDPRLASRIIGGARWQLGLIHERYTGDGLAKERAALVTLSGQMARLQEMIVANDDGYERHRLAVAAQSRALSPKLVSAEARSLYNPDRLHMALTPSP